MARSRAKLARWPEDSTDSWLDNSNWSQTNHLARGASFHQLLDLLNSSQRQMESRWSEGHQHHRHHHHRHHDTQPVPKQTTDHPGTLTVTSDSEDGLVAGATITANVRDPDGVKSATYQWSIRENGQWHNINGATSSSLALGNDDAGKQVKITVTCTDKAGHVATLSKPIAVAAAAPEPAPPPPDSSGSPNDPPSPPAPPAPPAPPPNTLGVVNISSPNGVKEGATLTANVTDADGFDAAAVAYAWQANINGNWQNIGTGKNHTIGFNEGGHDIRVRANYTDGAGHAEAPQSSLITAIDVDRPGELTVTSSGNGFVQGATITAHVTDPDGVGAVDYQWLSMGIDNLWHPIGGATSASYTLTANDAGKQLDVVGTYIDLQGHHDTAADPFTVAAPPAPPPPAPTPEPVPPPATPASTDDFLLGINLSGAEVNWRTYPNPALPGVPGPSPGGYDYQYPTHAEVDYYASKGMEIIRLPFLWERLQPTLNGPFNSAELARLEDVVNYATSKGLMVDIDPHNYGKYYEMEIGTSQVPFSAFANFWGQLASAFENNPNVIFGLMNEPTMPVAQWLQAVNAAIDAIRDTGATQEIWVPGNNNTGPAWVGSDNAKILVPGVKDPLNNYTFEVHAYLDPAHSGGSPVISATEGVAELTAITNWARTNHVPLVLGELGVGTEATDLKALDNTVAFMAANTDVWHGFTYWAGGPFWNLFGYRLSAEPTGLGTSNVVDKPQMDILEKYTGVDPIHPQDFMPTS